MGVRIIFKTQIPIFRPFYVSRYYTMKDGTVPQIYGDPFHTTWCTWTIHTPVVKGGAKDIQTFQNQKNHEFQNCLKPLLYI